MADIVNPAFEPVPPTPTGSFLVLFEEKTKPSVAAKKIENTCGVKSAHTKDFKASAEGLNQAFGEADAMLLDDLEVAVVTPEPEEAGTMMTALSAEADVVQVRPEFYLYAISEWQSRYASWVRDGMQLLSDRLLDEIVLPGGAAAQAVQETRAATWGIEAVAATSSPFSGKGIRVAILDTGLDLEHPDFKGRKITSQSFVPGESVDDQQGHGTHCTGTACGPLAFGDRPRYGVAYEGDIFGGKVLDNKGSGRESWILAGMEWAIRNRCSVISMSLGRPTQIGEPPDTVYERLGRHALQQKGLIVAAAGNESSRQFGHIAPVGSPANSPSIMAVGAVDASFNVADFSCGGLNPNGGEVDICGPGVDVFSSVPLPRRYARFPGTSMAAPHVAGIAALWAQSDDDLRGEDLWKTLEKTSRDIGLSPRDGGAGLVQAPQGSPIS